MKNVRCPRCKTEHRLPNDAAGYTCSECGTEWVFARCQQCHSTFHAPAHTASWTCKRCGFRNVNEPEPEPEPEPVREAGPSLVDRARTRWNGLSSRARLGAVLVPIAVIVVVLIVVLAGGGGGPAQLSPAAAKAAYCADLAGLQQLDRAPAVGRFIAAMKRDQKALQAAGDAASADQVKKIVTAAKKLKKAIESNKNIDQASTALNNTVAKGPSC